MGNTMLGIISRRRTVAPWLWVGTLLLAFIFTLLRLSSGPAFQTDLLGMFPAESQSRGLDVALNHVGGVFERELVLVVEGDVESDVISAAKRLASGFDTHQVVTVVDTNRYQQMIAKLYEYRHQLLSDADAQLILDGQSEQLNERAIRALYSLSGAPDLVGDPWLTFRQYLYSLISEQRFIAQDGLLLSKQAGQYQVLLQLQISLSPYDTEAKALVAAIDTEIATVEANHNVIVWKNGAAFYATEATAQAIWEMSVIGGGALTMIVVVVVWLFRRPKPLLLALVSIGSGVMLGVASTLLIFQQVHLFALVMGSTLIGISFDYAFHFLSAYACQRENGKPITLIRRLRPALLMGLCSSLLAYSSLYFAALPVLAQMATFSIFGLTGALLTVLLLFPVMVLPMPHPVGALMADRVSNAVDTYVKRVNLHVLLVLLSLVVIAGGINYHCDDNVRILQSPDSTLQYHEQKIQQLTGTRQSNDWIITFGPNVETVLEREELLRQQLDRAIDAGELDGYLAVSRYTPSLARQHYFYALHEKLTEQQAMQLSQTVGLNTPPMLLPFQQELRQSLSGYIPTLIGTTADGEMFSLLMLQAYHGDVKALQLPPHSEVVNYVDGISDMLMYYRIQVSQLFVIASLVVAAFCCWRFGFRSGLRVVAAPLCAAIVSLSVPAALGLPITLFHWLSLFLVLGIGLDYSVFFQCHGRQPATVLAVLVAGISTLLSFGLMSVSTNYAIASFGLSLAVGVLSAWLLAPLMVEQNRAVIRGSCDEN